MSSILQFGIYCSDSEYFYLQKWGSTDSPITIVFLYSHIKCSTGPKLDIHSLGGYVVMQGYNLSTEKSAVTSANQAIIKRFNHHSTRVLETAEHGTSLLLTNGTPAIPEEMPNKKVDC